MSHETECEEYPDIFRKVKGTDEEKKAIEAQNRLSARLYDALRHILINDFGFTHALPAKAEDFPGQLEPAPRAQYLAVHGIMLADNFVDPSLGKDRPSGDDKVIKDEHGKSLVLTHRFIDHAVSAVQEYTFQSDLFGKIYGFLRLEGRPQNGAGRHPQTTTSV